MTTASKLKLFDRVDLTFKTINDQPIQATILIPKKLQSKPRAEYPTIVNWHGGGFVIGHRMYEGWLPPWLLDLCLETEAIFITPDYRLFPESSASEILSDTEDFWNWLHKTLPTLTTSWIAHPDLSRLICSGQSSGGYIAVLSALRFPHIARIKLLMCMGSPLNHDFPEYTIPRPKMILGKWPPPPSKAEKTVRNYVKNMKPGVIRTSGDAIEMWEFLTCVLQQTYLQRWLGVKGRDEWNIMKMLETAKDMPPLWCVQGEQDSVVLPACSTSFVEKAKEFLPNVPILLHLLPGDHAFEVLYNINDEWVQKGIEFIEKYW